MCCLNCESAWLNNCVGHYNHRYFFMYMVFIVASTLFIMVFGVEIAYLEIWLGLEQGLEEELYGHPVRFNSSGPEPIVGIYLPNDLITNFILKNNTAYFKC